MPTSRSGASTRSRSPRARSSSTARRAREDDFSVLHVNELLSAMEKGAAAIVAAGALGAKLQTHRVVEMRYEGQGHEISVPLPAGKLAAAHARKLRAQYETRYERQFG